MFDFGKVKAITPKRKVSKDFWVAESEIFLGQVIVKDSVLLVRVLERNYLENFTQ